VKQIGIALILMLAGTAQAQSMGRLFFTPEQRILLDNARGQKARIEEQMEEPAPEIVSLNGMVKRDDGQTTVWLNNRAVSDRRTAGGVSIHPQGSASDPVLFSIPQAERTVTLRVGQNLDVTTGQVVEPYSPRAAEMKRSLVEKTKPADQASASVPSSSQRTAAPAAGSKPDSPPPAAAAPGRAGAVERSVQ
jgi:hypothetical protein